VRFEHLDATFAKNTICRVGWAMLRVGLTGGIAAGKSTVGQMLVNRGAHYLSADELAHQLYAPGAVAYEAVVRSFGRDILEADGTIDRKKLADLAFPNRIAQLNAIVHPAVIAAQRSWMNDATRADPNGIAVVEAALLLEGVAQDDFDKIIVVTCDLSGKVQRYARRAGVSPEAARAEVERRSAAQFSDEEKASHADYVIENSSTIEHTNQQVDRIWAELQQLSQHQGNMD
jgi:dephospho-CoA kinase